MLSTGEDIWLFRWIVIKWYLSWNQRTVYSCMAHCVFLFFLPFDLHDNPVFCGTSWRSWTSSRDISYFIYQCHGTIFVHWFVFSFGDIRLTSHWSQELSHGRHRISERDLDIGYCMYINLGTLDQCWTAVAEGRTEKKCFPVSKV